MKFQVSIRGLIQEARAKNFAFALGLMELIDNSVDAGATEIAVRADGEDLVVEDNGKGFEDIAQAINYAMSPKESGYIGRFGVGMKHMFMKFAHVFVAESRGRRIEVPVTDILEGTVGEEFDEPLEIPISSTTRIKLLGCFDLYSGKIDEGPICRAYEQLIVEGGVRIAVNGKQLEPLPLPDFMQSVDERFEWRGRRVHLFGGIYHPADDRGRQWLGYNPYYMGRLIGRGRITNHGVGDEGCTNFAFLLHLEDAGERWHLATNKDAVEGMEDLLAYCYDHFTRKLLIDGASSYRDIELQQQEKEITDLLNKKRRGPITRNKPGSGGNTGTVAGTGGGPPKNRTFTSDGRDGKYSEDDAPDVSTKKFAFRFSPLGFDIDAGVTLIGQVSTVGRKIHIDCNKDHPFIKANRKSNAFVLLFAQMAYGIESNLRGNDFYTEDFAKALLSAVGYDLAFYTGEDCTLVKLADIKEAA